MIIALLVILDNPPPVILQPLIQTNLTADRAVSLDFLLHIIHPRNHPVIKQVIQLVIARRPRRETVLLRFLVNQTIVANLLLPALRFFRDFSLVRRARLLRDALQPYEFIHLILRPLLAISPGVAIQHHLHAQINYIRLFFTRDVEPIRNGRNRRLRPTRIAVIRQILIFHACQVVKSVDISPKK